MNRAFPRQTPALIFGTALVLALALALYTNRVWEDYYITYRSSKNLATGYGLVFNRGEHLHTFTSPLGVLLPAVASLLTGNRSDTAALWIFRLMCALALGGGITLLVALARRLAYPAVAAGFLALFLVTDAKILDFTINGMETAFMVLFLAWALWAHFSPGPRQWLHLGAAWAGLMWTRPDSFIYVGLIAGGVWLFNRAELTGGNRRWLLGQFARAGLVAALLYGPWLAWATWYYGTPVPHTIVAKGGQSGGGGARLLAGFWRMPWLIWQGGAAADGAFLPPYYMFPPWPAWMLPFGRTLATIASLLWVVPRLRPEARAASLAYFGGAAYLSFVPYFPFPWYFPSTFVLAAVALAGALAQAWANPARWLRYAAAALAALVLAGALALTCGAARQARAQQALIEDGNRRRIGEWLKEHAQPGDAVFMEPLGYIGFFSGLKTHDWPGMSSRELVAATLVVGMNWGSLIRYLQPEWLVLRPDGEGDLAHFAPDLARSSYRLVKTFDRLADVQRLDVPGRKLLEFDARFHVYQRIAPLRHDTDGLEIATPYGTSIRTVEHQRMRLVHAPGLMVMDVPAGMRTAAGVFGFPPDAIEGGQQTDGARFHIYWTDGRRRVELLNRPLNPATNAADRGLQPYRIVLPSARPGDRVRLTFETDPNAGAAENWRDTNTIKDWTLWSSPEFSPEP